MKPVRVAMLLALALVTAHQWASGAFPAEFDGAADEAAHFVTSLMVRDALAARPAQPMEWAQRYYDHYPKVALGHWPPGLYVAQAAWWLVFPAVRWTALLLQAVYVALAAGLILSMAWKARPRWSTLAVVPALVALPVVQQAYSQVMAESACLLLGALVLRSFEFRGWQAGAVNSLALLVKPTFFTLLPGVGLLWLRRVREAVWLMPALLPAAAWYGWRNLATAGAAARESGILAGHIPWSVDLLPAITGTGLLALAGIGVASRANPICWSAAGLIVSVMACSYVLRGIREPRHWILLLPAVLVLAVYGYAFLERKTRWAPVALLAVLALYPFEFYRQQPAGAVALFEQLRAQGRLPARMWVSSADGWREGSWIATVAERELRPASSISRATKFAALSDWSGFRYQLRLHTPADFARHADATGTGLVIVDTGPPLYDPLPHHAIAMAWLSTDANWRRCGSAGRWSAYCRAAP
jgi:hypothetical protein